MMNLFSFVVCFSLVFNFTLLYLDEFKLSEVKFFRVLQRLSPLLLLIFIILVCCQFGWFYSVMFVKDEASSATVGASVEISKEAASEIKVGLSTVGSNAGLAGTIGAITAGVAKVVSKSSMPPLQKVGVVIGSSMVGAGIHIGASAINKFNADSVCLNSKGNVVSFL